MNNLYIIIVTYNAMKWIEECLNSIKGFKVIIVDNNSDDGTVPFIQQHFSEIEILPQDQNLGFGKANNIGISRAIKLAADYVFLLNQDAYLYDDTIERLLIMHQSYPEYGILSPIHLNGKGDKLDQDFHGYISHEHNQNFISDHVLDKDKREIYEVPFINAAGWFITRKCIETVGGFDPIFYHYGEDDNFCQRVQFHGLKVGIVSNTYLRHDREKSLPSKNYLRNDPHLRLSRQWKIHFANINQDRREELDKLLRNKKRSWYRTALKFHSAAKRYKKEYQTLCELKPQIEKSREINILKGKHYL